MMKELNKKFYIKLVLGMASVMIKLPKVSLFWILVVLYS